MLDVNPQDKFDEDSKLVFAINVVRDFRNSINEGSSENFEHRNFIDYALHIWYDDFKEEDKNFDFSAFKNLDWKVKDSSKYFIGSFDKFEEGYNIEKMVDLSSRILHGKEVLDSEKNQVLSFLHESILYMNLCDY